MAGQECRSAATIKTDAAGGEKIKPVHPMQHLQHFR